MHFLKMLWWILSLDTERQFPGPGLCVPVIEVLENLLSAGALASEISAINTSTLPFFCASVFLRLEVDFKKKASPLLINIRRHSIKCHKSDVWKCSKTKWTKWMWTASLATLNLHVTPLVWWVSICISSTKRKQQRDRQRGNFSAPHLLALLAHAAQCSLEICSHFVEEAVKKH